MEGTIQGVLRHIRQGEQGITGCISTQGAPENTGYNTWVIYKLVYKGTQGVQEYTGYTRVYRV